VVDSGDLLGERYRLGERVATGGMGEVWRATDVLLDRAVAVKVLRPGLVAEPGFTERFRSEARTLAGLHHPNVVSVYDYGEGDTTYLVMAFVEGEPLSTRIESAGRLSVDQTVSIVTQAAAALHAVHLMGVVHRDVKPGNLLIQPNGTVVLVDFGVARSAASGSVTKTHEVIGTALYMAPEQVSKKPLSPATDVYALGAVAYHCLAGRPPFEGDNALQVALQRLDGEPDPLPDDVPEGVRAVVMQAMAREPEDRYANAEALAEAMRAAVGGAPAATTALLAGAGGTAAATAVVPAGAARPGAPATTASFPAAHAGNRYRKWWAVGGALLVGAAVAAAITLLPDDGGGGENPGPGDVPSSQAVVTDEAGSPTRRPAGRTTAPTRSASPSASPTEVATSAPTTPEASESEDTPESEEPVATSAAASPAPAPVSPGQP
jgi:predicted Ser/Thr protein kinase